MSRLCFSTADDPFYKAPISKFYPEAIVFDSHGEIVARVGPDCKKADDVQMNYMDDFRDPALKVNDDRKVQISLNAITKPGTMILLVIKENDLTGKPVKDADFERAWFRLSNEETNQTLDFSKISHLAPEEYNPIIAAEDPDDENAQPKRNELTYVHGRLFLTDKMQWVFESYKTCFQSKD